MKYIKYFDSVADMNAALTSSSISVLGMAFDNGEPVIDNHEVTPTPPEPDYSIQFFVENITDSNETLYIRSYDFNGEGDYLVITVEYSTDGTSWSTLGTTGETALTRTLQPNDKVYLRASTNFWYEEWYDETTDTGVSRGCTINGVSKVGGNIMSLLYGSNFTGNERTFPSGTTWNFCGLFYDNEESDDWTNTVLVSASELLLPATTLAEACYTRMFGGCTSLASAPVLPATTLANLCYVDMFNSCESLTTAPALPATTLAESCYADMFCGCTSLTTAPALPATTLAESCYADMFGGCTALTTAPALPATTLAEDCYNSMFYGCTALTTAPTLPATTLAINCYFSMFIDCTSLTTAPELPATTLAGYCYDLMFQGCTNLNYIKCLATNISAEGCTDGWVFNVAATGTFVKNPSMSSWTTGDNGIPSGWTVEDATE